MVQILGNKSENIVMILICYSVRFFNILHVFLTDKSLLIYADDDKEKKINGKRKSTTSKMKVRIEYTYLV